VVRGLPASNAGLDADVQDVRGDEDGQHRTQTTTHSAPLRGFRGAAVARPRSLIAHAAQTEQQRQIGESEDDEDRRVVVRADCAHERRTEDRSDTEMGVQDVQHRGRTMAEAYGEELVKAVVDAAEPQTREQRHGEGYRPGRGEREAGCADGHEQIGGCEDLPVADPAEQPVEEQHPDDTADEVGAQSQPGGRRREVEVLAESRDGRSIQGLEGPDEHEARAGRHHRRGAEHRCLGQPGMGGRDALYGRLVGHALSGPRSRGRRT
jgi:hypothetical protein